MFKFKTIIIYAFAFVLISCFVVLILLSPQQIQTIQNAEEAQRIEEEKRMKEEETKRKIEEEEKRRREEEEKRKIEEEKKRIEEEKERKRIEEEESHKFVQPTFVHPRLDTTKFYYDGECREPFKYKRNNKRDLLFHAYYFKDEEVWNKKKTHMKTTFEINKSGIPNATKVFFTYGDWENEELNEVLKNAGYQIIKSDVKLEKGQEFNVAVYRYYEFEKYLLEHKDEYDRVVISDVQDVYWFADGFQTIDPNEFIIMLECDDKRKNKQWCRSIGYHAKYNEKWIRQCFNETIVEDMKKVGQKVINSGFVAGSPERMLEFLKVYNKIMKDRPEKFNIWGLDQSSMIVGDYLGLFNHLNITYITYSQRIGNDMRKRYNYDKENKIIYMRSKKCSPVIRHKVCV